MTYQRILVAIDKSEPAQQAIIEACRLAKATNATLKFVHVMDMADYGWEFINTQDPALRVQQQAAHEIASRPLTQAAKHAAELGVNAETECLPPQRAGVAAKLLELAAEWQAELVIMGTHGRDGIDHFLLGSVAERVVRHAKGPVMLVRTPD